VELIQPKCIAVGKHKPIEFSEQEHAMVCNIEAAGQLESVRSFKHICVNGHTVCSKEYSSRSSRRNNSIIAYKRRAKTGYGLVLKFILDTRLPYCLYIQWLTSVHVCSMCSLYCITTDHAMPY